MVNLGLAVSFGSHFARCGNLRRQGIDVRQSESSQFITLDGLFFGNAVDFVYGVVTQEAEAMRPVLQVGRKQSFRRERVNTCCQILARMLWRQVFRSELERPSSHCSGGIPIAPFDGIAGLNKCASYGFRAVGRGFRSLRFRNYPLQSHSCGFGHQSEVAMQFVWWCAFVGLEHRDYRQMAVVAHEERVKSVQGLWQRNLPDQSKAGFHSEAVWAIKGQGGGHE